MGKHNGKARKSGLAVGSALVNRAKKDGRTGSAAAYLHTTDAASGSKPNMQSVIESNDLDEMMAMASLAGKDFTAEREHVIVISTGAVATVDQERLAAERAAAEERNRHRLRVPRRPSWDEATTSEQLQEQERAHFYQWRRELASLEQDERLVLTPCEKNLEVWRQLWRVLERSDVVVQVVDARDPLTYYSEDLERYALELHPTKRSLLLLNKADLLPAALRTAWADHFDGLHLDYAFWSAKAGMDEHSSDEDVQAAAKARQRPGTDTRARVLGVDDLLDLLVQRAAQAAEDAEAQGVGRASRGERLVVGLTGYPNVGKSSTINALFGSKKTAVAPTPGKTKHFQTLNVTANLCLCDCPGLVLPQYAHSKAEMVAAGVIPIDRLTDVRAPVEAVAQRVGRRQLESVYGLRLPPPGHQEDPHRPPTAIELLRAFAYARGWVAASGLPDETRAGRRILKDYVDGKILYFKAPPGALVDEEQQGVVAREEVARVDGAAGGQQQGAAQAPAAAANSSTAAAGGLADRHAAEDEQQKQHHQQREDAPASSSSHTVQRGGAAGEPATGGGEASSDIGEVLDLDEGDLLLMDDLDMGGTRAKAARPAYKFHKKQIRSKGLRGQKKDDAAAGYDGAAIVQGKRGGIVQV